MKTIIPIWSLNEQFINLTDNAVNSIKERANPFFILVDNGSTYGAGQIREWADLYIRNKTNLGYAKAVNEGLKMCEPGEIVCISNNDIRISPEWSAIAYDIMQDPKVGSVHFRMIPYEQPFNPGNDTWVGGKERWCTSSFFVVRNVQLYDEDYFNSYEDWDFWHRMRNQGYIQAYTNKAEYQHMDSFTQQFVQNRGENDTQNRAHFKEKFGIYPEDNFAIKFPEQMKIPWRPMP